MNIYLLIYVILSYIICGVIASYQIQKTQYDLDADSMKAFNALFWLLSPFSLIGFSFVVLCGLFYYSFLFVGDILCVIGNKLFGG